MAGTQGHTARKTAVKLKLVNWSRFQDVTMRLDGSTLVTGVNGSGKSTILDALTYLLTGNTQFNKAAGDRDRTVLGYVRGDTRSNGSDRYLRGSGEVISYIAAEFDSPQENEHLVVGTCIESRDQTASKSWWFVCRGATLADMNFSSVQNGKLVVTPRNKLEVSGKPLKGSAFLGRDNGVQQILRALGLRCESSVYRSKLLKMLAFRPENNIDRFIQDCVLEPGRTTSLQELREQRRQFENIRRVYDSLKTGKAQLEEIERRTQEYENRLRFLQIRELMLPFQELKAAGEEEEAILLDLKQLAAAEANLRQRSEEADRVFRAALERKQAAENNDTYRGMQDSIRTLETQRDEAARGAAEAEKQCRELTSLREAIRPLLDWEEMAQLLSDDECRALEALPETGIEAERKAAAFIRMAAQAGQTDERLGKDLVHLEDRQSELKEERSRLSADIKRLESNLLVYPREVEAERDRIAAELRKRGIDTPVRMLAELVEAVKDKTWRKAIETFLGRKRFYLIIDGKYCHEAMKIVQELGIHRANLVITDRLPDVGAEPGSAAEQLTIPNVYARRFANYLLNGIFLCETLEELHDHPKGGLMRDGMLAKSYAVTSMDMSRTEYCLGLDAVKLQLQSAKKKLERTQKELAETEAQLRLVGEKRALLRAVDWREDHYTFRAPQIRQQETRRRDELTAAIEAIRSNPDFMAVLQEQARAQELYDKADLERTAITQDIGKCQAAIESARSRQAANAASLERSKLAYELQRQKNPELEDAMHAEYDRLHQRAGGPRVILPETVRKVRTDLEAVIRRLEDAQLEYCKSAEIDINRRGVAFIPFFREQLREISSVKIEKAQEQLAVQSEKLESAFMNDFVAELNERVNKAIEEKDAINRELRDIPFGRDTYQFTMNPRPDRAVFFRICKKLENYMDSPEVYLSSGRQDEEMETDIREFMSVILDEPDEAEYTDYRKYFTYDMQITSRQGATETTSDLSRKQGSASGGEKQTPYFIILAASLIQCYPRGANCARLAFIDEAFSAMSAERVEQMVRYLEENDFQVIYSAPPEKIGTISPYITTTISLVMTGRYTNAVEGLIEGEAQAG